MCGTLKEVGKLFGASAPDMPKPLPLAPAAAPAQTPAQAQAETDASAAQSANAKLAARNKRRGASLLATGAGDTGLVQSAGGKSVLGA